VLTLHKAVSGKAVFGAVHRAAYRARSIVVVVVVAVGRGDLLRGLLHLQEVLPQHILLPPVLSTFLALDITILAMDEEQSD
jgi:hypothetical protein